MNTGDRPPAMSSVHTYRPPVMGITHMVCAGHNLAAAAGYRILEEGGNAVDAGVATGIAINVVIPENTNFAGVAPIIIYLAESDSVVTISGLGRWPRAASIDYFREHCGNDLPLGILRALVPSAPDAWLSALERYGTMTLEQVITPALELARDGFPLSAVAQNQLVEQFTEGPVWPANAAIFMPGGTMPKVGDRLVQSALADTFTRLVDVERAHAGQGRGAAIRAARDYFYRGDIGRVLQMLADDDLGALGHNSADYIHLLSQALNLSFADRDHFFGDPDQVDVPIDFLMSSDYTQRRRAKIDMQHAFADMPPPGLLSGAAAVPPSASVGAENRGGRTDTSYACVVDRWGNAFSATPSDPNATNPIIPELGFSLSCRGYQSWLDPAHASSLAPWKRPRLTPNPAIAFHRGKLFMPFGCPGGDAQCQAMVQTFLNIVEFGMNPQAAVEQPRFSVWNFPNSFWPHDYLPARLNLEGRIDGEIAGQLAARGHDVCTVADWDPMDMGVMSAITVDPDSGVLSGGADPRRDTYAIGR